MTMPVPDIEHSIAAVRDSAERFAALLRSVDEPGATAVGHWSAGETAAHTTHIYSVMPKLATGGASPVSDHRQMGGTWERLLGEDTERDMEVLAQRIESSAASLLEKVNEENWTTEVRWHGRIKVPVFTLAAILVNEAEVHGYDIAKSQGSPWQIAPDKARLSLKGLYPVLPHFVDPDQAKGLRANFSVDLRDKNPAYMLVEAGALKVTTQRPRHIDCRISADPVAYLLVGYGRVSQVKPILTGKILAFGKKPWLGLRFAKLFTGF